MSHDLYSHSTLGLTASRDLCYNADVSLNLVEKTSLHVFAGREHIASQQDGSQSFTAADWFAQNDDTVDSLGAGLKRSILRGKMTVGGDYLLSHSIGKTSIDSGAVGGDFPDLKSDLITITLYADYRLAENLTLHGAYWYGNYHVTDWQLNGINTTTIANVIGLGDVNTDYDVRAMIVTLRYRF